METRQPLSFDVAFPEQLSRGQIFVKWLLIIPSPVVLYVLYLALSITTFIAFFAILFAASYPRGMFDFFTGVMR